MNSGRLAIALLATAALAGCGSTTVVTVTHRASPVATATKSKSKPGTGHRLSVAERCRQIASEVAADSVKHRGDSAATPKACVAQVCRKLIPTENPNAPDTTQSACEYSLSLPRIPNAKQQVSAECRHIIETEHLHECEHGGVPTRATEEKIASEARQGNTLKAKMEARAECEVEGGPICSQKEREELDDALARKEEEETHKERAARLKAEMITRCDEREIHTGVQSIDEQETARERCEKR
jgi:hypothetical protein